MIAVGAAFGIQALQGVLRRSNAASSSSQPAYELEPSLAFYTSFLKPVRVWS